MKLKHAALSAGIGVVLLGGAYGAYDYFAGNHVEVKEVIAARSEANGSGGGAVDARKLNGKWTVQPDSEVYFSVTTSKETVNFAVKSVKGSWLIDAAGAGKMAAEGSVDLNALDSGNSKRDDHIKGADYLQVEKYPEATFKVKSFEQLPAEWKEGTAFPFRMAGTLSVKGISKEVVFESKGLYENGAIKLEGSTVVTFDDFGMKNPHAVLLDTQNNVTVQLRLVLKPEQA